MKKLLMSSLVLLVFSCSIFIFQMSCKKTLLAQDKYVLPPATTSSLGGVIVGSGLSVSSNGVLSTTAGGSVPINKILYQSWPMGSHFVIINSDGTNPQNISLPFPEGADPYPREIMLSPDGKRIFYSFYDVNSNIVLASCNIDTSDMKILVRSSTGLSLIDVR